MPRPPRADQAGSLYHALNRGNLRADNFKKQADFVAFEKTLHEGGEGFVVELFGYQLTTNHYHLVLRQLVDREMSRSGSQEIQSGINGPSPRSPKYPSIT